MHQFINAATSAGYVMNSKDRYTLEFTRPDPYKFFLLKKNAIESANDLQKALESHKIPAPKPAGH